MPHGYSLVRSDCSVNPGASVCVQRSEVYHPAMGNQLSGRGRIGMGIIHLGRLRQALVPLRVSLTSGDFGFAKYGLCPMAQRWFRGFMKSVYALLEEARGRPFPLSSWGLGLHQRVGAWHTIVGRMYFSARTPVLRPVNDRSLPDARSHERQVSFVSCQAV